MKILLISNRIEGFLVSFFFLFLSIVRIVDLLSNGGQFADLSFEIIAFFLLSFIASTAYVLSWRYEGLGGLIMTICGLVISAISEWKLGLPFFVVGQLFVLYWFLLKSTILSDNLKLKKRQKL